MSYIGEREIASFEAKEEGNWIVVTFTNGETAEMSGTIFFKVQTEAPVEGTTTSDLVASYFATELLGELATNRIQLGMLSYIMNAIENITNVKKERAFTHAFGKKHLLQVGFDQMLMAADEAEQQEEALKENERLAKEESNKVSE